MHHNNRRERVLQKCRKMREAKERIRLARASTATASVIGTVSFDGPAFGGHHDVRLIGYPDRPTVDIEVDGRVTAARTPRGAIALLLQRIGRQA